MNGWKNLERHPLSAEYEDLVGDRWDGLVASIQEGFDRNRPIMLAYDAGKLKIVDGWQRQRAGVACDVKPVYQELGKDEDLEAFVARVNDYRRHETETQKERRLNARRNRVAQARAEGKSFREIADEEGIDPKTARNDAKAKENSMSGGDTSPPDHGNSHAESHDEEEKPEESDEAPANHQAKSTSQGPKTTTGLDGKTYSATKPAPILCGRCTRAARVGQTVPKDCEMCRELRGKKRKPKADAAQGDEKNVPVDAFQNPLPKNVRAAYQDKWIQHAIDALAVIEEKLRKEQLVTGMQKRAKHYPFFNAKDFVDGVGFAQDYLDRLLDHLKENRPAGVCPPCAGKGCSHCKLSGLVPRELYAKLLKEVPK